MSVSAYNLGEGAPRINLIAPRGDVFASRQRLDEPTRVVCGDPYASEIARTSNVERQALRSHWHAGEHMPNRQQPEADRQSPPELVAVAAWLVVALLIEQARAARRRIDSRDRGSFETGTPTGDRRSTPRRGRSRHLDSPTGPPAGLGHSRNG